MNTYTKQHLRDDIELSYTDNGEIEILISPGFGAGWSTWNDNSISLAVDKRIIDYFKKNGTGVEKTNRLSKEFGNQSEEFRNQLKEFLKSIGYNNVYTGGWEDIVIETIKPNCKFRIDEYDGSEELISYPNDELWEL